MQQSWPGLPKGVEFNPSDSDLLWHLAAEVGNGLAHRHPFINEFIKYVDDDRGFCCTHPRDIPGLRQDGRASYFFHRRFESHSNENDENISWQKFGSPRSIILDETLEGCKEVFVLYADMMSDNNPQKTDWRLHQYHIRSTVKDEGDLVVSKIFYDSRNNPVELAEEAPVESEWDVSTPDGSREKTQAESHSAYISTDELDHISLKERCRILLADKTSCPAMITAGKSIKDLRTSMTTPARNHKETAYKEDICHMLQEISSAPPIIESDHMDDESNRRLLHKDLSGLSSVSGMPSCINPSLCEVGSCHDPMEGTENHVGGSATCGSENGQLVVRKQETFLADVKLEPAFKGYEIDSSESPRANSTHAEGSVPILGVKGEAPDSELPCLCENIYVGSRQRRRRKTSYSTDKTLEEDAYTNEGIAYCSRRRRRKKTATDSIEKALDEDAPGLLQILLDRGIAAEEIKLYGAQEDDEMLPDSMESKFEDLENVIEKSRYLQFRDCPVEWGWCRDLQSFIFVFRSHNRIVLERPEYGYATYFFEVMQSLPIEWQIRRLVTAMKLSGCGRTALIENRPLLIGEDLTEGEARVLEEYGWIRNTGLGTMLNYRDRVVHDRWSEKTVADWRAKIGKLLMTGYAEGQSITSHGPKKVWDLLANTEDAEIEIKLEDAF